MDDNGTCPQVQDRALIHIHAVFWKFACLRFTPHADNIIFSHEQNLKDTDKDVEAKTKEFYTGQSERPIF